MRISKKILAIALSILMAVSMMPFTALADGEVVEVTNNTTGAVKTLTSFPATLNDGSDYTYKLLADATRTQRVSYGTWANNITLDLNGHTLTSTATDCVFTLGRNGSAGSHRVLNIVNTASTKGKIIAQPATEGADSAKDGVISIGGTYNDVNIGSNVAIEAADCGIVVGKGATAANVTVGGTITANGSFGITVNGLLTTTEPAATITVNAAVTGADAGIYAAGYANYIINSNVTGATGIYQKGGNVVVNKGTVKATGDKTAFTSMGNGMQYTGDAIVVEDNSAYPLGTTEIKGGTVTSTAADTKSIAVYNGTGATDRQNVTVTGGTFKAANAKSDVSTYFDSSVYTQDDNGKIVKNADIAAIVTSATNGKVTYLTSTTSQIQVGSETVKLVKDFNCANIITSIYGGANSVLDLNGHTVNCTSTTRAGISPRSGHTLTIKNTAATEGYINMACDANVTKATLVIEDGVTVNGEINYFDDAVVTIDGTVNGNGGFAVSSNNTNGGSGTTLNITENAVITNENGVAIYHPEIGTLNITGGTITGTTGVYAKRGTINISGGTINGTGAATGYKATGNGCNATGDALVLDNMKGYAGTLAANITGGTFISAKAKGIASYAKDLEPITGFIPATVNDAINPVVSSSDFTDYIANSTAVEYKSVPDYDKGGNYAISVVDETNVEDKFNLTVDDNIDLNVYVDVSGAAAAAGVDLPNVVVEYKKISTADVEDDSQTIERFNYSQINPETSGDAAGMYKFSYHAAPAQIADTVTIVIKDTVTGEVIHESQIASIKDYCDAIIADKNNQDSDLVELCETILDYGKAANDAFDYTSDSDFGDYNNTSVYSDVKAPVFDTTYAKAGYHTFTGFAYIATSQPAIRLYVSATKEEIEASEETAIVRNLSKNDGSYSVTPALVEGTDKICIDIKDIAAEDLDDVFEVSFAGSTIKLNALAYTLRTSTDPAEAAMLEAFRTALLNYNRAAELYFG